MLEIAYSSESGMYFERDRVPGMYCTTGTALCKDLNPNEICICPKCEVYKEYELNGGEPQFYFCQNGKSR